MGPDLRASPIAPARPEAAARRVLPRRRFRLVLPGQLGAPRILLPHGGQARRRRRLPQLPPRSGAPPPRGLRRCRGGPPLGQERGGGVASRGRRLLAVLPNGHERRREHHVPSGPARVRRRGRSGAFGDQSPDLAPPLLRRVPEDRVGSEAVPQPDPGGERGGTDMGAGAAGRRRPGPRVLQSNGWGETGGVGENKNKRVASGDGSWRWRPDDRSAEGVGGGAGGEGLGSGGPFRRRRRLSWSGDNGTG
ncbi:hypothetical protein BT93_B1611 [Corymbia citriodora subsp. variegata]|nr:hypothetical protein BT93_B1611 [Corymbia citriodora subsp. variegata]